MWKRNVKRDKKRRTIVFNVDVAKRRRSSAEIKAARMWRRAGAAVAAGGLSLAAAYFGSVRLAKTVEPPAGFTVRSIEVGNTDTLSKARIVSLSGIKIGDSLLASDLGSARKRLCVHPDIRDAVVSRRIPGRIIIKVYERLPVASVYGGVRFPSPGSRRYVIDEEGVVLSPLKERAYRHLPYIAGIRAGNLKAGERLDSAAAAAALEVLKCFRDLGLRRRIDLVSVDMSDRENCILRSEEIREIRLGNERMPERLRLLAYILNQREARGMSEPAGYIDLRWKDVVEMPLVDGAVARR